MFEFLDHTADTGVRLTAADPTGLVQSAVEALRCIYLGEKGAASFAEASDPETTTRLPIDLDAEDGEGLLVDLLSELIFLFDTRRFLCTHVEVVNVCLGAPAVLEGTLVGRTAAADVEPETEVKAATHHGLEIRRRGNRLTADVVFDL